MVDKLVPSGIYDIHGTDMSIGAYSIGRPYSCMAMYVRDEKISGERWHVFASFASSTLLRVRVPADDARVDGGRVNASRLVHTLISEPRNDPNRSPSINSYLDEAQRLANQIPSSGGEIVKLRKAIKEALYEENYERDAFDLDAVQAREKGRKK